MDGFFRTKIIERLNKKKNLDSNGCHTWKGKPSAQGYGTTHVCGKIYRVHTLIILLLQDFELDTKIRVKHKCDNKLCFNPDHLEYIVQKNKIGL